MTKQIIYSYLFGANYNPTKESCPKIGKSKYIAIYRDFLKEKTRVIGSLEGSVFTRTSPDHFFKEGENERMIERKKRKKTMENEIQGSLSEFGREKN